MNTDLISKALGLMGKGMAGIFTVILVIMLVVWLLAKLSKNHTDEE